MISQIVEKETKGGDKEGPRQIVGREAEIFPRQYC